jgi:hypothetical protein
VKNSTGHYRTVQNLTGQYWTGQDIEGQNWRVKRLNANAKVATVLGSVTASSDTMKTEGRQMKQCSKKHYNFSEQRKYVIWYRFGVQMTVQDREA